MDAKNLVMLDGTLLVDYLKENALVDSKDIPMDEWTLGYETCKSRLAKILIPQIESGD